MGWLKEINMKAKVIFTVSPVRHIKDGFTENHQSKGRLLEAILTAIDATDTVYFPSYEIMMDELRDYRFYKDDLLHPNTLGVQYIWERFQEAWIEPGILPFMEKISNIQKSLAHKPFNPNSAETLEFSKNLARRIEEVRREFPNIEFK